MENVPAQTSISIKTTKKYVIRKSLVTIKKNTKVSRTLINFYSTDT